MTHNAHSSTVNLITTTATTATTTSTITTISGKFYFLFFLCFTYFFFCLATKPSHLPPQRPRRWPQRPHTIINADATYLQPTSKPLSIEMAAAATAAEVQKGEADFETVP